MKKHLHKHPKPIRGKKKKSVKRKPKIRKPKSQWMQFPTLFECRQTGKISHNQVDVLPKSLTLDPNFIARWRFKKTNTLFREMSIVSPKGAMTSSMRKLFKERAGRIQEKSKSHLLKVLQGHLSAAVAERWKPGMFHVILHSSGYDSRMLSWTIKTLYKKRGSAWLGDVMFLCTKWEGACFKLIMRCEKWKKSQYCVVGESARANEYYAPIYLNFTDLWKHTNGPASKLNNIGWYLIEGAEKAGIVPEKNIQLFTGEWGNTVLDAASSSRGASYLRGRWQWRYMSYPCGISYKCDELVQPFTSIDLARRALVSSLRFGEELRSQLLKSMNGHLYKIKRFKKDERFFPSGTPEILGHLLKNYIASWYAKNVRKLNSVPRQNQHDPRWSCISAASFCDYLLKNGCKIAIG